MPEAFDLVLEKMLERDPTKRTQYAGDVALAFERVVKMGNVAQTPGVGASNAWMQQAQITIPPTVNWFDEEILPADSWQADASATTRALSTEGYGAGAGNAPAFPGQTSSFSPTAALPQAEKHASSLGGTDPFLWWSSASTSFQAPAATPGSFASRPPLRLNPASRRRRPQPGLQDRRNLTKLLVTGGVAAGVVVIGGVSLARMAQSQKPPSQLASTSASGANAPAGATTTAGSTTTPTAGSTPGATMTSSASSSPTSQATSAPGSQPPPTAKPTQPPRPPTPTPGHTGTVIGHTSQGTNTAVAFTNPADGQACWLVHMGNGNFVAVEQACTHAGVAVNYQPSSGKFLCPAHGAMFNADGSNPTSPAPSPLPKVTIRVNGDGTITTG